MQRRMQKRKRKKRKGGRCGGGRGRGVFFCSRFEDDLCLLFLLRERKGRGGWKSRREEEGGGEEQVEDEEDSHPRFHGGPRGMHFVVFGGECFLLFTVRISIRLPITAILFRLSWTKYGLVLFCDPSGCTYVNGSIACRSTSSPGHPPSHDISTDHSHVQPR